VRQRQYQLQSGLRAPTGSEPLENAEDLPTVLQRLLKSSEPVEVAGKFLEAVRHCAFGGGIAGNCGLPLLS
jgi:hypothetical protein